jgi:hypothetical protein
MNDETGFEPRELESYSGMQMALKQTKALDVGRVAIAQGSNSVSAEGRKQAEAYAIKACMVKNLVRNY